MPRRRYRRSDSQDLYEALEIIEDELFYKGMRPEALTRRPRRSPTRKRSPAPKKARKLTAWNRYVKNKKNHIKMRDGKLNLKKMAVQFRKKKR